MEVQVDIESKPGKLRHHSGGSADDGARWTCASSSSCKWAKEASCASSCGSGAKKSKGKLRKKGGGTKINETREDMDAQLLERRSTNSSEPDSASLSGSLPSVADSHSSHFSEFSGSDPESVRTSCSHGSGAADYHARFAAVSPLPEVENDRLETCPASSFGAPRCPASPASSLGRGADPLCFTTENVNPVCPAELDSHHNTGEPPKDPTMNQNPTQTQNPTLQPRNSCIQTDI